MKDCRNWTIPKPKLIPYGHPKRSLREKIRKAINTILFDMAYLCPINSWRIQMHRWRGCHIGKDVYIGRFCNIDNLYPEYIYIYDGASINAESMILTHFNPFETYKNIFNAEVRPVVIGLHAIVSVRSTIMPGVRVGDYAVVSAGCTIEHDIPDYHMVATTKNIKEINIKGLF